MGVEGGSWDAVRTRWGWNRWEVMRRSLERHGPPEYVSAAAAIGFKPAVAPSSLPKPLDGSDFKSIVEGIWGPGPIVD